MSNAKAVSDPENTTLSSGKLKSKDYERELATLHIELVKLQEWVRHKGRGSTSFATC
jgi:polyphosphate kinase